MPPNTSNNYLSLALRTRVETFKGSGLWDEIIVEKALPVEETAILVCDVWDNHWCSGAARRVDGIAVQINSVIEVARSSGVQIIHSPSDTVGYYADTPHRQKIAGLPPVEPPVPRALPNPPLPIDDSDGGCDSGETESRQAWTKQHPSIGIKGDDVISDDGREIYGFLRARGIKNLCITGFHTNMCVLNRSFGIKQMTKWGIDCVLVRDLTDAMYNPERSPYVSHESGTELVVEHIEKHWCPSILSDQLLRVGPPPAT